MFYNLASKSAAFPISSSKSNLQIETTSYALKLIICIFLFLHRDLNSNKVIGTLRQRERVSWISEIYRKLRLIIQKSRTQKDKKFTGCESFSWINMYIYIDLAIQYTCILHFHINVQYTLQCLVSAFYNPSGYDFFSYHLFRFPHNSSFLHVYVRLSLYIIWFRGVEP